jgi:Tfp pilus assembly protein PilX
MPITKESTDQERLARTERAAFQNATAALRAAEIRMRFLPDLKAPGFLARTR